MPRDKNIIPHKHTVGINSLVHKYERPLHRDVNSSNVGNRSLKTPVVQIPMWYFTQ